MIIAPTTHNSQSFAEKSYSGKDGHMWGHKDLEDGTERPTHRMESCVDTGAPAHQLSYTCKHHSTHNHAKHREAERASSPFSKLTSEGKDTSKDRQILIKINDKYNDAFNKSTSRGAIESMLYRHEVETTIDLTAAYLRLTLGRVPDGVAVYKLMLSVDCDEAKIIKLFRDYIKTDVGAAALNLLLATSSSEQQTPELQPLAPETGESRGQSIHNKGSEGASSVACVFQEQAVLLEPEDEPQTLVSTIQVHSDGDADDVVDASGSESEIVYSKRTRTSTDARETHTADIRLQLLEREHATLSNKLLCRLCKQRQVEVVFLPCGHVVVCESCSEPCQNCPCCGADVLAEKRIYLA